MVGMFLCLCLARPKDVYAPTRMDLDVKLLRLRARQLFKLANIISGHKLKSYYPCMKLIKISGIYVPVVVKLLKLLFFR